MMIDEVKTISEPLDLIVSFFHKLERLKAPPTLFLKENK
jgi:hypothetical protein